MAIIQLFERSARCLVCLGVLSTSTLSFGAVALPQITQPVNTQQRVVLKGNVRPMPSRAHDMGAVDISTPASRMLLLLKRPAEQEAALQQYIAEEHTPGSASYRRWLTPAQLGSQFGPAESDVQAVVAWLQSQGLAVAKVSQARTMIEFSGTAGQIESALATKIHTFQLDGVTHFANVINPQVPAALAPVIAGVSPLNDFRPRPMHTASFARTGTPAPTSANPKAMSSRPTGNQPELTFPTSNGNFYAIAPADFAIIYNTPTSLNSNNKGTLTGSGVTIGIAGDSNVDGLASGSNVAHYRSIFGLPPLSAGSKVVVDGNDPGTGSDDEVEALLDLEVASAVAPAADLIFYTAQDTTFQSGLYLAIQRALDDNAVSILNVSFGGCEAYQTQGGNQEILNFWEQAAAQGISVTVSTGDSGAAGCDNPNTETSAAQGLQVNGIGSTPYNIAVGGTDFNQTPANESTYWSSSNSGPGAGGSALGAIPEIPWNDSTTTIGSLSGNKAATSQGTTNISGAGGGASGCLNADVDSNFNVLSCTGAYAKPTWQTSFGPASTRQLPDVSLFSATGSHDSAWVLCASNLGPSGNATDCVPDGQGSFGFLTIGGTSASAPAFAGVLALVEQQLGGSVRVGQADYTLYPLSKQFPASFHDVTTGNISVVCLSGSLNCGANGFLTGYNGGSGYDMATGLGSMDVTQLVQNWSKVTFQPTTTSLTVNGSTSPVTGIVHGTAVNIGVTVTSSGGTPTGDVALVAANGGNTIAVAPVQGTAPSPSIFTLTNGTATDSSYPYLPGSGSTAYTLTANYGGDGTFGPSTSNGITVAVTPEASSLSLAIQDQSASTFELTPLTGSVPYGTFVSVAAEPFSAAEAMQTLSYYQQATGTVTFTSSPANAALNQTTSVNSNGIAELSNPFSNPFPPGTYTVKASYSGDPSFSPSTASGTFTIAKNSVSVTPTSTNGTAVVQVDPSVGDLFFAGGFLLPSGVVTVTDSGGNSIGSGDLALGMDGQGNQIAQATITLTGTPATASYAGDNNYNPGTGSFSGGGGGGSFTLSAAPSTLTISSGGSKQTTMNVTPASGFTGTVKLTCSAGGSPLTCSLAQPSVSVTGSTAVTDTLTVNSTSSSALDIPSNPASRWYAAGGAAFAGILLIGLPGRRRAWQRMLSLVLLFIAVGVVGCGGSSSGGNKSSTYTVTVTATSGTVSQTSTVSVTVQ